MMDLLDFITPEIIFCILLIIFVLTVFTYLIISGLLSRINVDTCETRFGPMVVAFKARTGPYKGAGDLFTDSYCLLPNREQVGIYYDDPETVPENELRYAVGPILSNGDQTPSKEEMDLVVSHGFKIFHVPKPNFVVTASFPFRTTLSIFIAIFRVYPKLRRYIAERNLCAYPAIEVYADSEIVFIMPLSRQEEFFVPEFQDDEVSVATTDVGSVVGERDFSLKDEDLFLKPRTPVRSNRPQPRTPVRITRPRASGDSIEGSADEDDESVAGSIEPVDDDEVAGSTTSSYDELTADTVDDVTRNS